MDIQGQGLIPSSPSQTLAYRHHTRFIHCTCGVHNHADKRLLGALGRAPGLHLESCTESPDTLRLHLREIVVEPPILGLRVPGPLGLCPWLHAASSLLLNVNAWHVRGAGSQSCGRTGAAGRQAVPASVFLALPVPLRSLKALSYLGCQAPHGNELTLCIQSGRKIDVDVPDFACYRTLLPLHQDNRTSLMATCAPAGLGFACLCCSSSYVSPLGCSACFWDGFRALAPCLGAHALGP